MGIYGYEEVWSKRLVQDTFRIGSDLNELHWFRIASAYVPCLQGTTVSFEDHAALRVVFGHCER